MKVMEVAAAASMVLVRWIIVLRVQMVRWRRVHHESRVGLVLATVELLIVGLVTNCARAMTRTEPVILD